MRIFLCQTINVGSSEALLEDWLFKWPTFFHGQLPCTSKYRALGIDNAQYTLHNTMRHLGARNNLKGSDAIVEGKGGWIMLVVVPPAHTNIQLATATQCSLF